MHTLRTLLFIAAFWSGSSGAQLQAEKPGITALPEPAASWFLVNAHEGSYIFDAASGEMQGLLSHQWYTPAMAILPSRAEAYYVESFYSRGVRGERQDVLTVADLTDLSPKTEIDIPDKAAALWFRHHIGLLADERHLVIFNMTPAQSVSIVDVVDREFVGEISTPGCAIIMPTGERAFMMICGDGTLQYIELDADGRETARSRSRKFFSVEQDAVFDKPVLTRHGWLLVSFAGQVYEVSTSGSSIEIAKPWSLLAEEDAAGNWRPGGSQPFTVHRDSGLLYALMHQGGVDTHHEAGAEVWVFDAQRRTRVARMKFETPVDNILTSQEASPSLYTITRQDVVDVYDGLRLRHLLTIEQPGPKPSLLQTLTPYD
ncbi:MAG TPA: amine dehydrogenase large subunit [Xanthomonadales bacterium]|nr:amine dehydrogenase large subunit [Xanthomonadales bacterium]